MKTFWHVNSAYYTSFSSVVCLSAVVICTGHPPSMDLFEAWTPWGFSLLMYLLYYMSSILNLWSKWSILCIIPLFTIKIQVHEIVYNMTLDIDKNVYLHNKINMYIIYYKWHEWLVWITDLKSWTVVNDWQINALATPTYDALVTSANGKSCFKSLLMHLNYVAMVAKK